MAKADATPQAKSNEHPQSSIDSVSLALIRFALQAKDKKQGELRTAYTTASLRGLDTDAGKEALKLVKDGNEAIDAFFTHFRKVSEYVGLLGKTLSPAQYEMFGPKVGPLPEDERAKLEGRAAGFDLDPEITDASSPYEIGSLKGQAWLSAFNDARQQRDTIMSMQPPTPEASNGEAESAGTAGDEGKA